MTQLFSELLGYLSSHKYLLFPDWFMCFSVGQNKETKKDPGCQIWWTHHKGFYQRLWNHPEKQTLSKAGMLSKWISMGEHVSVL